NIETAYLLQRIEDHDGLVILATNLPRNLDDAFARRIHHALEFPFPDPSLREKIWRRLLPPTAPVADDVDFPFLARQLELSGGNIRNVVLAAAFAAAAESRPIAMPDFIAAAARELRKIGRLPGRAEFGEYYDVVCEGRM
ncbi:MAG TPA: ATP-binding protein, partial [Thermoanaerobaculia bacterium]